MFKVTYLSHPKNQPVLTNLRQYQNTEGSSPDEMSALRKEMNRLARQITNDQNKMFNLRALINKQVEIGE